MEVQSVLFCIDMYISKLFVIRRCPLLEVSIVYSSETEEKGNSHCHDKMEMNRQQ